MLYLRIVIVLIPIAPAVFYGNGWASYFKLHSIIPTVQRASANETNGPHGDPVVYCESGLVAAMCQVGLLLLSNTSSIMSAFLYDSNCALANLVTIHPSSTSYIFK